VDALTIFVACGLFVASPAPCNPNAAVTTTSGESQTARLDHWQSYIREASQRFGIPEAWIRAVMRAESAGLTMFDGKPITSSAGAMGLMQLMPDTWREMRERFKLRADPYDPRDNIAAGAAYLRQMYDRYGYPNLFAAYHAGPGRFDAYLKGLRALPSATSAYLAETTLSLGKSSSSPTDSGGLFVPLSAGGSAW
jgi:soluble lytic murein transglycosylase-like protein